MFHVIHAEKLLEAHAADAGHGVQTGQGQGGDAHCHKDGGHIDGHAEHLKEAGNTTAEDLERGAAGRGAVRRRRRAGHAEGQDGQHTLQHHGAVADLEHIFFVLNGLGGGAGRNQTVEAGNRTAGHRDKQDGEQAAQLLVLEAGKGGQVHGGMGHQQADGRTGNHADEHECGHIVTGLFEQPHGNHGGKEDVDEGDIAPDFLVELQRADHTDGKGGNNAGDADQGFLPAAEIEFSLDQAEEDGKDHEHDGNHACGAVGLGGGAERAFGVIGVEGSGNHIRKGGDDQQGEQPAEQQEQLAAQLADVLFDQHTHALAVILDGGIQGAEVGDGAEKDAAQQNPQQNRQPAERGGLDGTGDRARARNGGELMAENGPAVGGHIILAVIQADSRGFRLGVNAPFVGQPATIERIGADQCHSRDQNDNECVHVLFPFSFSQKSPSVNCRKQGKKDALVFRFTAPCRVPTTQRRRQDLHWFAAPLQRLLPRYHFACRRLYRPLTRCPHCTVPGGVPR